MDAARTVLRDNPAGLSQTALLQLIRDSGITRRITEGRAVLTERVQSAPAIRIDGSGLYRMDVT